MSLWKEFKEFAMRGNVLDLAVGVIIGAAFGKITTSLVADIITPPIGLLLGQVDFGSLSITLKEAVGNVPAVKINYGKFIQTVIDFIIIAAAIFLMIKSVNKMKTIALRKEEEAIAEAPAPEPTKEEILLTEIRDILKNK